ncbi:hypothetical protein, partial [Pectobacterium versatile]|uniref:hypothetical protein n=1 Tax=Pectobacterium versatile TaxID=2488639 RepID=UPI000FF4BEDD
YFKLHVRWLPLLTPVTYLSKLLEIRAVAACLQLELFRVSLSNNTEHSAVTNQELEPHAY